MRPAFRAAIPFAFGLGFVCGFLLAQPTRGSAPVAGAQEAGTLPGAELAAIRADIERLKQVSPDQAHAMQDVGYHFSNLWFAGQEEHWELASFYWSETRSHLRWAVRIIPLRKDNAGKAIDLEAILQSVENGPLKQLQVAIDDEDRAGFESAYRFTLEGCYSCHKASDKPFLRPQIPIQPDVHSINFNPQASWPK